MKKKNPVSAAEDDLLVDLAFHNVPASMLMEFSERIVKPYYRGNLTGAIKDLIQKAVSEQEIVSSHIILTQN